MSKSFLHYLLIVVFSVLALSANAKAMDMTLVDVHNQQLGSADMHHQHVEMNDCDQPLNLNTENVACCDGDCSCMMMHCNKTQMVLTETTMATA